MALRGPHKGMKIGGAGIDPLYGGPTRPLLDSGLRRNDEVGGRLDEFGAGSDGSLPFSYE